MRVVLNCEQGYNNKAYASMKKGRFWANISFLELL